LFDPRGYRSGPLPTIGSLGLPQILEDIALTKHGMLIFVGPTGSGKSTTLAVMVNHLNENEHGHVLTVEDPNSAIQTGNSQGMQTPDQNLAELTRRNIVSPAEARAKANFPENFPERDSDLGR